MVRPAVCAMIPSSAVFMSHAQQASVGLLVVAIGMSFGFNSGPSRTTPRLYCLSLKYKQRLRMADI